MMMFDGNEHVTVVELVQRQRDCGCESFQNPPKGREVSKGLVRVEFF